MGISNNSAEGSFMWCGPPKPISEHMTFQFACPGTGGIQIETHDRWRGNHKRASNKRWITVTAVDVKFLRRPTWLCHISFSSASDDSGWGKWYRWHNATEFTPTAVTVAQPLWHHIPRCNGVCVVVDLYGTLGYAILCTCVVRVKTRSSGQGCISATSLPTYHPGRFCRHSCMWMWKSSRQAGENDIDARA